MQTLQEMTERRNADMQHIARRISSEIYNRAWESFMADEIEQLNRTLHQQLSMTTRQRVTLKVKIRFDFSDSTHMMLARGNEDVSHAELIEAAYDNGCWADSVNENPINVALISEVISVEFADAD